MVDASLIWRRAGAGVDVKTGSIGVGVEGVSGPKLNLLIESGSDSVVWSADPSYLWDDDRLRSPNNDLLLVLNEAFETVDALPYAGIFLRGVSGGALMGDEG